ncbi:NTP-binding protein [Parazoarcus communis]|uniref:NTP-binding protein n=1 Tax=Parazoarcus communis TaxID=41977 RepID=A0A2U8GXM4_9RHOO|nr:STAS domain-containing protein [Parazoarcus communis]AWI78228.1 NTP-binding protein [Parazoarcus communis]
MAEATVVRMEGVLTMRTIAGLVDRALPEGNCVVDLAAVVEADSAALALLLEWSRRLKARGDTLSVTGMPDGLKSLSELYGLDEVLPIAG